MAPNPDDPLERAIQLHRSGAFAEAAWLFAALRETAPDKPTLARLHGLALVRGGDGAAGLPLLIRARDLAPAEPLAHLHLGIGLHAAGQAAEAVASFRAAAAMLPDAGAPLVNLAVALLDLGDPAASCEAAARAVVLEPGNADAHLALGRARAAGRDLIGARSALAEAVRLRPDHADSWVSLGLVRYRLADPDGALEAMRQALRIAPAHALAEANLAAFLGLRGEQDEAIRRLRAIVARAPGAVAARLNLVNQLMLDGERAEALALLEGPMPAGREGMHWRAQRVIALVGLGRRVEARAELAQATGPPGDAEILLLWMRIVLGEPDGADREAQLACLAELADAEDGSLLEHRVIAHFDLAGVRERGGDDGRAFEHWRKGHRLLGRMQPFSRPAHTAFIDASIARFDAGRSRLGPYAEDRDPTPVFIVGLSRSGTTLTEQILAAHPLVHGAGERLAVYDTILALAGSVLTAESVVRLAGLDAAALTRAGSALLGGLHALSPAAPLITDKMPGNGQHLGFLAALLPGARVIRCTRDPRDVGLSIFRRRFFGYHPYAHDLADLGWYIGEHERLMAHWGRVLPVPMLTIALTDWIDDFAATLARLLDFLDLPPAPECERFHLSDRRVRTASRAQVRRPVNAEGIGRWRKYQRALEPLIAELARAGLVAGPASPG
ncbi:MAG TPA: sulfotransferase [Acetobacteraceae bacterium]